jgi:2-polyprenyl-3-methyl-5-hydroxy-6-metoxy-1,4-benzoquinol methylase
MKWLDRALQRWRIRKVRPFLHPGSVVLDVGSADGALFRALPWLGPGVGIDPHVENGADPDRWRPLRGAFPADLPPELLGGFDALTLLAVLEHVPDDAQPAFARACFDALRPGGHLLITVPAPAVDRILDVLMALRILDGMEVDEHHGYEIERTVPLFTGAGFVAIHRSRFQMGLNHFFAFQRPQGAGSNR